MRGCRARLRTGCLWAVVLFVGLVVLAGLAPDREEEVGAVAASPTAAGVAAVATDAPVMPSSTPEPTVTPTAEPTLDDAGRLRLRLDAFAEGATVDFVFVNNGVILVEAWAPSETAAGAFGAVVGVIGESVRSMGWDIHYVELTWGNAPGTPNGVYGMPMELIYEFMDGDIGPATFLDRVNFIPTGGN